MTPHATTICFNMPSGVLKGFQDDWQPTLLTGHLCLRAACTADGNGITYNEHINVALAVAMPDGGLITPVIKDADATDIYQISRNWADLVKRARSKQLAPDEFQSGTFTISNLGNFGADIFDAILPPGAVLRKKGTVIGSPYVPEYGVLQALVAVHSGQVWCCAMECMNPLMFKAVTSLPGMVSATLFT